MATKEGHDKVVALLLTSPYTFNPATIEDSNFTLIEWGAMKGHDKVVATLLADPRIDPTAENNAAVEYAVRYNHSHVVIQLLDDPRVNDTVDLSILYRIDQKMQRQRKAAEEEQRCPW